MSTNSVAKAVYAQNNALSQEGNSQANQEKEQSQTSGQENQVVSGDSSILSGNNIQCNSQINSKTTPGISDDICAIGGLSIPDPNDDKVKIKLIIKFDVDPQCVPGSARNHGCNGFGGNYIISSGFGTTNVVSGDVTVGEGQSGKTIEVSLPYSRQVNVFMSASNPFLNLNGYEVLSSHIDSKPDGFNCRQIHGILENISCSTFNAPMDGQEKVFSFTFKIVDRF